MNTMYVLIRGDVVIVTSDALVGAFSHLNHPAALKKSGNF